MLPKKYRLVSRGDFTGVFDARSTARSGPITLLYKKTEKIFSRFGFVVSGTVSKKAVRRNRIRRQLHEIIRTHLFLVRGGYDAVFRTYPDILDMSYQDISKHVEIILKKSGIMKNKN
jgi:ribonuclease P protein component